MRTRLHLKPGQKGTKKLLAKYGDRLVCVRYRYDAQTKKRYTTVELIVEEGPWQPTAPRLTAETIVGLHIDREEIELRQQIRAAGGTWNPSKRVWELRYDRVQTLGLKKRIVKE